LTPDLHAARCDDRSARRAACRAPYVASRTGCNGGGNAPSVGVFRPRGPDCAAPRAPRGRWVSSRFSGFPLECRVGNDAGTHLASPGSSSQRHHDRGHSSTRWWRCGVNVTGSAGMVPVDRRTRGAQTGEVQ